MIVIFVVHGAFYYLKHYLTNEETEFVGAFQSDKYNELIDELNNMKNGRFGLDDDSLLHQDMESELTEFISTV